MALQFLPVTPIESHLGQRHPALEIFGILLDEAQVLPIGFGEVATVAHGAGVERPSVAMEPIVVEDPAQIDESQVDLAFLHGRNRGLVVPLGAFFRTLASSEDKGKHKRPRG
jgi:hypothetical protein